MSNRNHMLILIAIMAVCVYCLMFKAAFAEFRRQRDEVLRREGRQQKASVEEEQ